MEGGAYLVIAFFFALAGGLVGRTKGSSFWLWALISGLIPVFGLLAVVFYRIERDELRKQCPRCGKVVMLYDALCMRCGAELDFPEVAIEPESVARARPS
jgi:ribosomal protein S27AE